MPVTFARWLAADVSLTPTEVRVLRLLGKRRGRWTSAAALARQVRGDVADLVLPTDVAAVRTHIWRLRKKLRGSGMRIENRYFHGLYRLKASDE